MKRLNKKGFAVTIILYSIVALAILVLFLILAIFSNERKTEKQLGESIKENLNEAFSFSKEFIPKKNSAGKYISQEYIIMKTGYYFIELWGAKGANAGSFVGGNGAKTEGYLYLEQGDKIYFYVGAQGSGRVGGYNGGTDVNASIGGAGGGATDVRLHAGVVNDPESLASRIMVAAGGGGALNSGCGSGAGGAGGGLTGSPGANPTCTYPRHRGLGATATKGGLTQALNAVASDAQVGGFGHSYYVYGHAGGGGGYYTGGSGTYAAAGGGSSFIAGHTGSVVTIYNKNYTPIISNPSNPSGNIDEAYYLKSSGDVSVPELVMTTNNTPESGLPVTRNVQPKFVKTRMTPNATAPLIKNTALRAAYTAGDGFARLVYTPDHLVT